MPLTSFISYSLLAFTPTFWIFRHNIYHYPVRIVLVVFGVFFYFAALIITSILYSIVNALFNSSNKILWLFAIINVLNLEYLRYLSFKLMLKVKPSFKYLKDSEKNSVDTNLKVAVAIGTGFTIGSAVFSSLNVIIYSLGPYVFGVDGKTDVNLMLNTCLKTSAISILNFLWTIMLFTSFKTVSSSNLADHEDSMIQNEERRGNSTASRAAAAETETNLRSNSATSVSFISNYLYNRWTLLILLSHLLNTLISLLGQKYNFLSILAAWILVIFISFMTFYQLGGSKSSIQASLENRNSVEHLEDLN